MVWFQRKSLTLIINLSDGPRQTGMSGPRVFQPLLVDPTQVESKKSSQIQWPVPSINAEPVDIFLGEE